MNCYNFFFFLKMSDRTTYYQRNREIILNRIKKYENNKESLRQ